MRRKLLILLHFLVGATAVGTGTALRQDPSGTSVGFEKEWLEGSPFEDYRVPGTYLQTVIASSNLLSALGLLRRARWAGPLSLLSVLNLLAWTVAQWRIFGYRNSSQVFWSALFGFMTLLSLREVRSPRRQ